MTARRRDSRRLFPTSFVMGKLGGRRSSSGGERLDEGRIDLPSFSASPFSGKVLLLFLSSSLGTRSLETRPRSAFTVCISIE